jgi:hypothetical protein
MSPHSARTLSLHVLTAPNDGLSENMITAAPAPSCEGCRVRGADGRIETAASAATLPHGCTSEVCAGDGIELLLASGVAAHDANVLFIHTPQLLQELNPDRFFGLMGEVTSGRDKAG